MRDYLADAWKAIYPDREKPTDSEIALELLDLMIDTNHRLIFEPNWHFGPTLHVEGVDMEPAEYNGESYNHPKELIGRAAFERAEWLHERVAQEKAMQPALQSLMVNLSELHKKES